MDIKFCTLTNVTQSRIRGEDVRCINPRYLLTYLLKCKVCCIGVIHCEPVLSAVTNVGCPHYLITVVLFYAGGAVQYTTSTYGLHRPCDLPRLRHDGNCF